MKSNKSLQEKIDHSLKIIKESIKKYKPITAGCSFGKDSMVLVHLTMKIDPNFRFFTVMTRYKPKETFIYKDKMIKKWNMNIKEYKNDEPIPDKLYKTDPDRCCNLLKVKPTKEALEEMKVKAWMTGLRSTEGITRKDFKEIEEYSNGLMKINPILTFTEKDIWDYIFQNHIPIHPLYGKGYRSLGCLPCSKPFTKTERSGRWEGTSKCGGECGIHSNMYKKKK